MVKFCRNCGRELTSTQDKACPDCGVSLVKANAYCRYCGHGTGTEDVVCASCGAAIKPIPAGTKAGFLQNQRRANLGKAINLTLVVLMISAYVIFSLPKAITKPIKAATAEAVQVTTGYTALPLQYIAATPAYIPSLGNVGEVTTPPNFTPNSTRQLTIYAIYKNINSENATKATRNDVVTENCTFKSSNERIATVSETGLVRAVAEGNVTITVSYTTAPGSSNRTGASAGKVPVTFFVTVPVSVGLRSQALIEAGYGGT